MRIWVAVAAVVVHVQGALGITFENQLHSGTASGAPAPGPVTWTNVNTFVMGTYTLTGSGSANWNIGILAPQTIRLGVNGFAGSLGSNTVSVFNVMTVTLTHETAFSLTGNTSVSGNASTNTIIAGAGIFGVPTSPDGSLRLLGGLGSISLSGTLLPGEYTIRNSGGASSGGFGSPASFSTNLFLTIPAPHASVTLLGAAMLAARRRRGAAIV